MVWGDVYQSPFIRVHVTFAHQIFPVARIGNLTKKLQKKIESNHPPPAHLLCLNIDPFMNYRDGWGQDVKRKPWKVCNRFPVVSCSEGAFKAFNGRWLKMHLFGWNRETEKCITLRLQPLYRLDDSLYHLPDTVSFLFYELTKGYLWFIHMRIPQITLQITVKYPR